MRDLVKKGEYVLHDVFVSVLRLPLLFRGDVMRPSSLAVLAVASPPMLVLLALRMRSGMRVRVAIPWALLGIYSFWAAGLLFGEPRASASDTYLAGHWINLVPFTTIVTQVTGTSGSARVQLIGNVGLLLPLGLIGPLVMPSLRRAPRVAFVALALSIAIELAQLLGTSVRFINRSVDVDDVILNVVGALLGWLLWRVMVSLFGGPSRPADLGESLS